MSSHDSFFSSVWDAFADTYAGPVWDWAHSDPNVPENEWPVNPWKARIIEREIAAGMERAQRSIAVNEPENPGESPEHRARRQSKAMSDAISGAVQEVNDFMLGAGTHPKQAKDFFDALGLKDALDKLAKLGKGLLYVGGAAAAAVALFQLNKIVQTFRKKGGQ